MILGGRELELDEPADGRTLGPVTLVTAPNWTAIGVLLVISFLHACNAIPAFLNHHIEGYMSAGLGTVFLVAALVIHRSRCEITFDPFRREIRLRSGVGRRFCVKRSVPFDNIHAVRLTISPSSDARDSQIEILCDGEDIECPPTDIPRQQALCLAVMMDVRLIKVSPDAMHTIASPAESREREPSDLDELHVHARRS